MICFMYPGQPMEREALPATDAAAEIAELVRTHTGFCMTSGEWVGDPASNQVALQITGTAVSLLKTRELRAAGIVPSIIAEHSMGVYAALAAAGSISEGESLELTSRIGRLLSSMATPRCYALGCVIGLTLDQVAPIAESCGVNIGNYNTSRHFLLAGEKSAIVAAIEACTTAGAFSARVFPSDAPLHSPLVEEITPELTQLVGEYEFRPLGVPVVEHLGQTRLRTEDIPRFLVRELCAPVYWEATWLALKKMGITSFREVGCGQALFKYNRWIDSEQVARHAAAA